MRAPRRPSPMRFLGFVLAILGAFAGVVPAAGLAPAAGRDEEHEPRLVMPGALAAHPGEPLVIHWTQADSVSELEILFSANDGATWYEITPPMDPASEQVQWRVPVGGHSPRLRIRYNRGGREIEGAPVQLAQHSRQDATPLALPPADGAGPPRGESRTQATRVVWCATDQPDLTAPRQSGRALAFAPRAPRSSPASASSLGGRTLDQTPGFIPLRT